jgi:lipopolysaccharide biosynthesis protein
MENPQPATPAVRLIAFYLPQFHPIPENDAWWGKGFTEWTNVVQARPLFRGHYQPHLPADLGFYDLRVPEVRAAQASLAREYGVHGFCYYHYWFGGRRLLERPLDDFLASDLRFPFCVCWANESWTRRWDGGDDAVLMAQEHSPEDDLRFIESLFPLFRDERHIRVNGRPLLFVWRADLLPEPARTAERWKRATRAAGIEEPYLVRVETFNHKDDPAQLGFDAACEFPGHDVPANLEYDSPVKGSRARYFDYPRYADYLMSRPHPGYRRFHTVMPSWDNTARRGVNASVFVNNSPAKYGEWLERVARRTLHDQQGDERIVMVNAWNEWAEGCHLEPDQLLGHAYLEATRAALEAARR